MNERVRLGVALDVVRLMANGRYTYLRPGEMLTIARSGGKSPLRSDEGLIQYINWLDSPPSALVHRFHHSYTDSLADTSHIVEWNGGYVYVSDDTRTVVITCTESMDIGYYSNCVKRMATMIISGASAIEVISAAPLGDRGQGSLLSDVLAAIAEEMTE